MSINANLRLLVKEQGERIAELERKIETTVLRFPQKDKELETPDGAYIRFIPGKPGAGGGNGGDIIFSLEAFEGDPERYGRVLFRDATGRVGVLDFDKMKIRPLKADERRPSDEKPSEPAAEEPEQSETKTDPAPDA